MQAVATWILILRELEIQLELEYNKPYICSYSLNNDSDHDYDIKCIPSQKNESGIEGELYREITEESITDYVLGPRNKILFF